MRYTRVDRIEMADALALVETWLRFPVQATTVDVVQKAAMTASRLLGCHRVLSEDLNAGHDYAGIVVANPFSDEALSKTGGF